MFMLLAGQAGEAWELPLCSASEVSMDRASCCSVTNEPPSPSTLQAGTYGDESNQVLLRAAYQLAGND